MRYCGGAVDDDSVDSFYVILPSLLLVTTLGRDQTLTVSCVYSPTSSGPPATPTCAGDTYTIQPGDTCRSVSLAESIGTAWLLSDNQLMAGCVDFPTTGTLCLVNTCEVHTVLETDTCESIAALYEITDTQLRSFNPVGSLALLLS